jgi:4-diphosphocytidyl-2-C-methyl-D-erythritol kinase
VHLDKRIPVQAGLGGGSADAAAMLRALNTLDGERFSRSELREIAAKIGADVPFLVAGGTALCTGIGEQITPVPAALSLSLVVAIGEERVSTPAAFAALDARYGNAFCFTEERTADALLAALAAGDGTELDAQLFNCFEEVVLPACPEAVALCRTLEERGALAARMSGSGPAVFGLFEDASTARTVAEELADLGYRAFACRLVAGL